MEVLKQVKITYTPGKIVNIYIVYEISKTFNFSSYPTLKNLVQLVWIKIIILISIIILDMVLDLTEKELFQ